MANSPLQEPFASAVLGLGVLSPSCEHTGNSATWKEGQDAANRERYQQRHSGGSKWQAHEEGAGGPGEAGEQRGLCGGLWSQW